MGTTNATVLEQASLMMVAAAACTSEDLVLDVAELDLINVLLSVHLDLLRKKNGVNLALPAV